MATDAESNYAVFRECASSVVIARGNQHKPSRTKRKASKIKAAKRKGHPDSTDESSAPSTPAYAEEENPEELADFIDVRIAFQFHYTYFRL
jgi:hypothetical protein